jgi:hypothetical protein
MKIRKSEKAMRFPLNPSFFEKIPTLMAGRSLMEKIAVMNYFRVHASPKRHNERVALFPINRWSPIHVAPPPLGDTHGRCGGGRPLFPRSDHLDLTRHGRQRRSAGYWIGITQQNSSEGPGRQEASVSS